MPLFNLAVLVADQRNAVDTDHIRQFVLFQPRREARVFKLVRDGFGRAGAQPHGIRQPLRLQRLLRAHRGRVYFIGDNIVRRAGDVQRQTFVA